MELQASFLNELNIKIQEFLYLKTSKLEVEDYLKNKV